MNRLNIFVFCTFSALAMLLYGCSPTAFMTKGQLIDNSENSEVLVTIVRPLSIGFRGSVDVWDSDKFVGMLKSEQFVQFRTTPGKHKFMANAQNWSYCLADLQPGKHYVVVVHTWPHMFAFEPVTALNSLKHYAQKNPASGENAKDIFSKWIKSYSQVAVDYSLSESYITSKLSEVRANISTFEKAKYAEITPDNHM
ncbi:MAG: hypothetical protein A2511_14900 [Deltaproteobacteria bacterium RIFOXYD12_FULL_50_9]|nr:MAG: hypothetical protein A2511_14900 [Deltaproteobacteria bacterium RIFOXYD12_FULL_50_9]